MFLNNSGREGEKEVGREELVDKLGSYRKYIASFNPRVYLRLEFITHSTSLVIFQITPAGCPS